MKESLIEKVKNSSLLVKSVVVFEVLLLLGSAVAFKAFNLQQDDEDV